MTSTETAPTSQDKLAKVRLLLAKADSTESVEEAEALTAKAVELMARHGIDEALLEAGRERKDEIIKRRITITNPYGREKASLICWVGNALRCKTVLHSQGKTVYAVTIIGFESDVDRLELLYTSLLLQATSQVIHQRPEWWSDESVAAFRRTWLLGFAHVVSDRVAAAEVLAAQQATQRQEQGSTATGTSVSVELVLVDRATRVENAQAEFFPKLGKAKPRRLTGSGRNAGRAAGARADIGQARVGGQRTAIG